MKSFRVISGWATTQRNLIEQITPTGVVTQFSAGITPGAQPDDIKTGPDGNLWFTELLGNGSRVGRITTTSVAALPPTVAKSFGAASIALNGSITLSFTVTNPNASALTGIGFTDTLPAGIAVSTPNGLSGTRWRHDHRSHGFGQRQPHGRDACGKRIVHVQRERDRHDGRHEEQHHGCCDGG